MVIFTAEVGVLAFDAPVKKTTVLLGQSKNSAAMPTAAGNAYHGIGIPQCFHSGEKAAEHVLNASESEIRA